jgi:hypothetical protein
MDELLTEQLEWLLSCNLQGNRLAHHILIISGCLADTALPEHISRQMITISRQVMLQETFDTLVNSLNQFAKMTPRSATATAADTLANIELSGLVEQVKDARLQLLALDPINYAELIAWITSRARDQKLWAKGRRR